MEDHDEDFVGPRPTDSTGTKKSNMKKNPWLESLRSQKESKYLLGHACVVSPNDEFIGAFLIDKVNPGITWTLSFFHDFEHPFIELEAQIRTANKDGQFNSRWPSQEASFKIFRENIQNLEFKKVIMGNNTDKVWSESFSFITALALILIP